MKLKDPSEEIDKKMAELKARRRLEKDETKVSEDNKEKVSPEEEMELNNARNGMVPEIVEKTDLPAVSEKTEQENEESKLEKERKEKIEQTEKELEIARKEYASTDFDKRKKLSDIRKALGIKNANERKDGDIEYYANIYQEKLKNYRDFKIELLKEKNLSPEEFNKETGELLGYFAYDERLNLYNAYNDARAEKLNGTKFEKIKNYYLDIVNKYRKLPTWKKVAYGLALVGAGTALGSGGVAGMTAAGALSLGRRFFSGTATFAGAREMIGGIQEKMHKRSAEKEKQERLEQLENKNDKSGDKFERLSSTLDEMIRNCDSELEKRKISGTRKNAIALTYGAFVASGYMGKLLHKISDWTGLSSHVEDLVSEHIKKRLPDIKINKVFAGGTENPSGLANDATQKVTEKSAEKATEAVLEVKKGSSFEGSIIQHLKANPDLVEKYNELNGGRKFNAGQIAHRMAHDFASGNEEVPGGKVSGLGLTHEGAKITINPDTMEVEMFEDDKGFGELPEHKVSAKIPETNDPIEEHKIDTKITPEENDALDKRIEEIKARDAAAEKEFSDVDQSYGKKIYDDYSEKVREVNSWEDQPASKWHTGIYEEHLKNLTGEQRKLWEELGKENTVSEAVKDLRKNVSIQNIENWKKVKDLTFDKIKDSDTGDEVKNRIAKAYRVSLKMLGGTSKPRGGETVAKWTERIARLVIRGKSE
jgi:hypothetical protein